MCKAASRPPQVIRTARISLTFVIVGPVWTRSPISVIQYLNSCSSGARFLSEDSSSSPWMSGDQRSVVMLGDRQLWRHAGWCDGAPLLAGCREEYHDLQGLSRPGGHAIRS